MAEKRVTRVRGVFPVVQQRARELRREMTPAEKILWEVLRGHRLAGIGFRRQHPVGKFVLDFYAPLCHLVIELDGDIHNEQQERDAEREAVLKAYGYHVLRFRNEEVLRHLPAVLERIQHQALLLQTKRQSEASQS